LPALWTKRKRAGIVTPGFIVALPLMTAVSMTGIRSP
jgi:hypothetical protein